MTGLKNISYFQVLSTAAAVLLLCVKSEPLYLRGDFDSQLQHILLQELIPRKEAAEVLSLVKADVMTTLNRRWQGVKLTPYGSAITGFCTKTSDFDFSLEVRDFNSSADAYVLQEAKMLFMEQPALYSNVKTVTTPAYKLVSFSHIPSQRTVDLELNGDEPVYNTKLIRYYIHLDTRVRPLGAFLKVWLRTHGLSGNGVGTQTLPNYALYLLVIFYLQQNNMAPPAYVLQNKKYSHIFKNWDVGFNELPFKSENTESLHQLLGGFFKYYSEFDFEHYIVSPFTGRPIPRNAFTDINNFPKEYTLNKITSTRTTQCVIKNKLKIRTEFCIQDVFVHSSNVAKRFSHELATKFKYLMKSAARTFEDLPSDRVLRAILETEQYNVTDNSHSHKEFIMNVTNEQPEQDCPVPTY